MLHYVLIIYYNKSIVRQNKKEIEMKEFEEFNGKDFENLLRDNAFVTESGAVDRVGAAEFLGVCKRTVGYMLQGRITRQMYNQLALHTGHHIPGLMNAFRVPGELTDEEFDELMEAADIDLPKGYTGSPGDRQALKLMTEIETVDLS